MSRQRVLYTGSLLAAGSLFYVYASDTRAGIYPSLVMPFFHRFVDAEVSHKWSIWLAKYGLVPSSKFQDPSCLNVNV